MLKLFRLLKTKEKKKKTERKYAVESMLFVPMPNLSYIPYPCPYLFVSYTVIPAHSRLHLAKKRVKKKRLFFFQNLLGNLTIVNLPVLLLDAQPLLQTLAGLPERARPRDVSLSAGMPVAVAGNVSLDVGIVV